MASLMDEALRTALRKSAEGFEYWHQLDKRIQNGRLEYRDPDDGEWKLAFPESDRERQLRELQEAVDEFKRVVFEEVEPAVIWLNQNAWAGYLLVGAAIMILLLGLLDIWGLIQLPAWLAPQFNPG